MIEEISSHVNDLYKNLIVGFDDLNLTINTDMATVVKAMANPDSGLEIRDRMWLKITIPNAFIGKWRIYLQSSQARPGNLVGCVAAWHLEGRWFEPRVRQHSFNEIGYEISTTILSLPLIQVEQLSVTEERICTKHWLTT